MTDRNDDHGGEPLELSDDDGFDPATAEIVEDTEPRELAAELIGELDEASPAADGVAMSAEERDGGADVDLLGRFGAVSMDDEGLSLPVDVDQPVNAPAPEEVTREDLAELAAVEAELDTRWPETKIDPSLERIEKLMDLLGNPERSAPVIHVAGTNGKTSTVRMIESLVRALGRRTGRTTSPHLQLATERIAIDGAPMHPRDYVRIWREIQPYVEMVDAASEADGGPRMSKFEVLTAMAYAAFADAPVDVAVVEVGMGGTWDATNVAHADVAVVCPVGRDHTDYLGDTLAEIAAEKAGIIKSRWDAGDLLSPPDNVAVIAEQEPEAMEVLLARAVECDAAVARAGAEYGVVSQTLAVGGQNLTLRGLAGEYEDIHLPLLYRPGQARQLLLAAAVDQAVRVERHQYLSP